MATILRPPLVSQGQPKKPIAPVDYFSRPLTLGINPNARVLQLSDSAPQRTRRIQLDVYPNLLGTTFGTPPTLGLPLQSGRVFESAPRKRWQPDSLLSQGLIVYDGPEAAIASLSDSAPQRRKSISVEQATNLLGNTLGQPAAIGLPLIAEQLDDSAPARKRQVRVEALYRPLTLGINPNAAVLQLSDSATPLERAAYSFDPPNLLLGNLSVLLGLPLNAGRMDGSAPSIKYQVRTETLYRPLTLGVNPNAVVMQQSDSAPPRKPPAYAFDPPNLLLGNLAAVLSLPLNAGRLDTSAPRIKYQVRTEALSRPLTLGITLPQAFALPLSAGRVDASAPIRKRQVRVEALSRPVTLGIPPNLGGVGGGYVRRLGLGLGLGLG